MTDRWIPAAVEVLGPYVRAGVIGPTEVQVTASLVDMARAAGGDPVPDDVVVATALAVRGPLHGHVRVDLSTVVASIVLDTPGPATVDDGDPDPSTDDDPFPPPMVADLPAVAGAGSESSAAVAVADLPWPAADGWADRLSDGPLARAEDQNPADHVEPLVVSGPHVYLERHWRDEVEVARDLSARAGATATSDPHTLAAVEELFASDPEHPGPDAQRRAALAALERRLVVIAGGPGTGKTRTVARLLAALQLGAERAGGPPLDIALAAPTGKAAARLTQAVAREVHGTELPPSVAEHLLASEARTVHRLLGYRDGGARFRHDARNPLTADVVVVDEVSMVSLPLMARLLEAVPADTRLVLVGDPHQLASVEAGAVLGDLVGTHGRPTPALLAAGVVILDRVHRFRAGSPVALLADAVNRGDGDAVVDLLRHGPSGTDGSVRWILPDDVDGHREVETLVVGLAGELVTLGRDGDVARALAAVGRLKVLAATRRGPDGVESWNRMVEAELRRSGGMRSRWSAGRPVMVTANDYLNGVFNGDVGVVVRPERGSRVRVAFGEPEAPRLLDPTQLDRVETQWAMTIHKSQGSEFSHVVITLPEPPSPILTRELLYTAVTRAKDRVTLVASEDAVRAAVAQPVRRASGLAERLS